MASPPFALTYEPPLAPVPPWLSYLLVPTETTLERYTIPTFVPSNGIPTLITSQIVVTRYETELLRIPITLSGVPSGIELGTEGIYTTEGGRTTGETVLGVVGETRKVTLGRSTSTMTTTNEEARTSTPSPTRTNIVSSRSISSIPTSTSSLSSATTLSTISLPSSSSSSTITSMPSSSSSSSSSSRSPPSTTSSSSSRLNSLTPSQLTVAISIPIILFFLIIGSILLGCCLHRRRKKNKRISSGDGDDDGESFQGIQGGGLGESVDENHSYSIGGLGGLLMREKSARNSRTRGKLMRDGYRDEWDWVRPRVVDENGGLVGHLSEVERSVGGSMMMGGSNMNQYREEEGGISLIAGGGKKLEDEGDSSIGLGYNDTISRRRREGIRQDVERESEEEQDDDEEEDLGTSTMMMTALRGQRQRQTSQRRHRNDVGMQGLGIGGGGGGGGEESSLPTRAMESIVKGLRKISGGTIGGSEEGSGYGYSAVARREEEGDEYDEERSRFARSQFPTSHHRPILSNYNIVDGDNENDHRWDPYRPSPITPIFPVLAPSFSSSSSSTSSSSQPKTSSNSSSPIINFDYLVAPPSSASRNLNHRSKYSTTTTPPTSNEMRQHEQQTRLREQSGGNASIASSVATDLSMGRGNVSVKELFFSTPRWTGSRHPNAFQTSTISPIHTPSYETPPLPPQSHEYHDPYDDTGHPYDDRSTSIGRDRRETIALAFPSHRRIDSSDSNGDSNSSRYADAPSPVPSSTLHRHEGRSKMDGDESNEGEEGGETIRFISNYIDNIDDNNEDKDSQHLPRNSAATRRRSTSASTTYPDSSFIQESPMVYSIPPTPSSNNPLRHQKKKRSLQTRVRGKGNRPDSEGEVLDRIAESFEKARKERSRGNGREEAEDEKEKRKRRNFDASRMVGEGERVVHRWGEDESTNRDLNDFAKRLNSNEEEEDEHHQRPFSNLTPLLDSPLVFPRPPSPPPAVYPHVSHHHHHRY